MTPRETALYLLLTLFLGLTLALYAAAGSLFSGHWNACGAGIGHGSDHGAPSGERKSSLP
jgi:hypothetical protein